MKRKRIYHRYWGDKGNWSSRQIKIRGLRKQRGLAELVNEWWCHLLWEGIVKDDQIWRKRPWIWSCTYKLWYLPTIKVICQVNSWIYWYTREELWAREINLCCMVTRTCICWNFLVRDYLKGLFLIFKKLQSLMTQ